MKKFISTALSLIFFLCFIASEGHAQETSSHTAYKGATLFDGTGDKIENSVILINEGRIVEVGDADMTLPAGTEVMDISGKFITPGLIDAHVHLSSTGLFDTRPIFDFDYVDSWNYLAAKAYTKNNIEKYYEAYLRSGVTGVYDTGGSPWTITLQKAAENDLNAPHVSAAGPLITAAPESFVSIYNPPVEKEMIRLTSDSLGKKVVQYNSYLGSTGIKIHGMLPDDIEFMSRMKTVAEESNKFGNKLIVHVFGLEDAKAALKLGAKLLVHSVDEQEVDEEFIKLMIENEVLYTPTIFVAGAPLLPLKALEGEKIDISDPNKIIDEKTLRLLKNPEEYVSSFDTTSAKEELAYIKSDDFKAQNRIRLINLKKLWEAGVIITVGSDAGGYPGTLHGISYYDELEIMQEAGIPPNDLIIMATRNGAMAMERLDDIGTLEKGKMADLIILEKDPSEDISNVRSISHVMRGGLLRPVDEKFDQ